MHEINKINDNNKHSNQNDNSGPSWKRETVRQSNVIACEIGKVSIRPLYNHRRTCKQIRIHVYDSKCDSINYAQKYMANALGMYSSTISESNIKWFTTKIIFNGETRNIKRINLIADLTDDFIDAKALSIYMKRVFESEFGSSTREHTNNQF